MKAPKIDFRIKTATFFFLFTLAFTACDVLEPDADALDSFWAPNMSSDAYILANNTAFIDLNSRINASVPVRLSVTAGTRLGELKDLGGGLLQYTPSVGDAKAKDSFEFTVFSAKNEILRVDTIDIHIVTEELQLSCGIVPSDDYVFAVNGSSANQGVTMAVPVLANDFICGVDPQHLVVSIHNPENIKAPAHGSATAAGQTITYTAGTSFTGADKVIYKVFPAFNPARVSYGIVHITNKPICNSTLANDLFSFKVEEFSGVLSLPVLTNDQICEPVNNKHVRVVQAPASGTLTSNANGFNYQVASGTNATTDFKDAFVYEVCVDAKCGTAKVDIEAKQ